MTFRLVFVHDPTDSGNYVIPIGKQTIIPNHIFYTPCSGIWQSVWIESAPSTYITQLDLNGDMHGQGMVYFLQSLWLPGADIYPVNVTVHTSNPNTSNKVEVSVQKNGKTVASHSGPSNKPFQFQVSSPKLWTPNSPNLYDVTVKVGSDEIQSYTGFRTISKGTVDGVVRPLLNGEFVFLFGTLDQGFWPDGIYTPPTKEAMVYDLQLLKTLGFNMIRKHVSSNLKQVCSIFIAANPALWVDES